MAFRYKKVLIIGATSGIGNALAARFVENGTSVIVVGRRKEQLDQFVSEHGSGGNVDSAVFDITNLESIPDFIKEQFSKHSDIDSVFINAGVQRHLDWTKPEAVNLDNIELEWKSNYLAWAHLTKAVLPYLTKKSPQKTSIIYTSSGLALIPLVTVGNYSATKAALHALLLTMRRQLQDAGSNVKIIELFPPAVQTELHDAKHQPEFGDHGRSFGMPLPDFTNEAYKGLCEDKDEIPVGMVGEAMGYDSWEQERQKQFTTFADRLKESST